MPLSIGGLGDLPGERRRPRRRRVLLSGKVILAAGPSCDCDIVELSSESARLQVESYVTLPDEFDLVMLRTGAAHRCRVLWRNSPWVGVGFTHSWDLRTPDAARQFHLRRLGSEAPAAALAS